MIYILLLFRPQLLVTLWIMLLPVLAFSLYLFVLTTFWIWCNYPCGLLWTKADLSDQTFFFWKLIDLRQVLVCFAWVHFGSGQYLGWRTLISRHPELDWLWIFLNKEMFKVNKVMMFNLVLTQYGVKGCKTTRKTLTVEIIFSIQTTFSTCPCILFSCLHLVRPTYCFKPERKTFSFVVKHISNTNLCFFCSVKTESILSIRVTAW